MHSREDILLSPQEAADEAGVHYRTILRMIQRGDIAFKNLTPNAKRPMYRVKRSDLYKVRSQK